MGLAAVLSLAACQSPDLACTTSAPDPDRVAPELMKTRLLSVVAGEWRRGAVEAIAAAGSLLQRRLDLPDATTMVLQGLLFVSIIAGEAFMPKERR